MSSGSAALAVVPSKVRSKITNDPAQRHGRTAEARRVKDLFRAFVAMLGNPQDDGTLALALVAAEAIAIYEIARRDHIAGKIDLNSVIRAEGPANRAIKRLGLDKIAATKPAALTLAEYAARRNDRSEESLISKAANSLSEAL